jgi:PAS domain S-box-containing protein
MDTNSEDLLQLNKKLCQELFSNMINGFALHKIITDNNEKPINYEFIEINPAFEKITGLKRKDIIGKRVTEVIPGTEKDPADWIGTYGKVALSGKDIKMENYSEGIKKWFNITAYSPKKEYFVTIFEDITERKTKEILLKESEEKYKVLFNSNNDAILVYGLDNGLISNFTTVNDVACKRYEYSQEELLNISPLQLDVSNAFKESSSNAITKLLTEGKTTFETVHRTKSGKLIPVEINSNIIHINNTNLVLSIARDITQRKKIEEELNTSTDILKSKISELEIFHKVAIGRELKMIELKEQIRVLETEILKNKKS